MERDRLIQLVSSQSAEINELKQEIEMLIRKPIRKIPMLPTKTDPAPLDQSIMMNAIRESMDDKYVPSAAEPSEQPAETIERPMSTGTEISIPPALMMLYILVLTEIHSCFKAKSIPFCQYSFKFCLYHSTRNS